MLRWKKRSSSSRFHSSSPKKHAPTCRILSSRTLFSSTRATCGSSAGGATCEGNSFSCCASPCSLKTSTVLSQRDCAELFSSPDSRESSDAGHPGCVHRLHKRPRDVILTVLVATVRPQKHSELIVMMPLRFQDPRSALHHCFRVARFRRH